LDVGTIVGGKYRLNRALGQGAMGSVWAAVHEVLGREVAIKFLRDTIEDPTTAAARFAAEAKLAAQVKHRFVVDVFDFGVSDEGAPYMVQELLQGRPLSDLLTEGPAWSLRNAVRFMIDCLTGLAAVHDRGIIHRDLKPENIFAIPEVEGSVPKLLDFGISKAADVAGDRSARPSVRAPGRGRLTAFGATLGTPAYMSPEHLRNLSTLDARADLYSMGVVIYEWLAGHCPYASTANFAELVDRIEARALTPLEQLRPDVGPALCAVVARALEPDRAQRFSSALEMRAALAKVLDGLPEASTRVQRATHPSVKLPALRMPLFDYPLPSTDGAREAAPSEPRKPLFSEPPVPSLHAGIPSVPPVGSDPAPARHAGRWWALLAAAIVLSILAPLALRAWSASAEQRAAAHPLPITNKPIEAGAKAEIPYGELPPEVEPEQEQVAPRLPPLAPRRLERSHKPAKVAAPSAPRREPGAPAARPTRDEAPEAAPEKPGKLLRSLDF
jgi:serine/threonine protein kinase